MRVMYIYITVTRTSAYERREWEFTDCPLDIVSLYRYVRKTRAGGSRWEIEEVYNRPGNIVHTVPDVPEDVRAEAVERMKEAVERMKVRK